MDKLTPSEIIKFRAECYISSDGAGVYSLYATGSDLRKLFTADAFSKHFKLLTKECEHAGLLIVSEVIKNNLAEVKYIEHISESGKLITYYSKTFFNREDDSWKIIKEKREKQS